ncbi:MAG: excinuclease ABC subunit UvrC [Schleiferiaceae bacterium]|nr:MAG: UvrABC system protein C [Cryomorphaceae bacterium]
MATSEHITNLLKTLPHKPGVYQHIDKDGKILYIGKAKNLKKRVSSYFTKTVTSARIAVMVRKVADIRTIITDSEGDALLLENNLIKEHQPRYNINLKDDKSYPYITIRNERFPRIYGLRNLIRDGSEYYGPYPNVKAMKAVLELIKQMYPTRTCKYVLSAENIEKGKFKTCLEYHIGNCKGPCEDLQSEEDYNADIDAARKIIKGQLGEVKKHLKERMNAHAGLLEFELAQRYKEKLVALETYAAKSTVVSFSLTNIDVFSVSTDAEFGYVNYLKIVEGAIVRSYTVEMKKKLDENPEDFLHLAIPEIRDKFGSNCRRVFTSHAVELALEGVEFIVPQKGEKKKLIELSLKNALYFRQEKLKNIQIVDPERHVNRIMTQMKEDLRMPVEPRHLECFDNSNMQGTNPASACVVFKNGKPSKKDYRQFNIKTVEGPDDYASMEEVVYRRYKRLMDEGEDLPQLIVIDGGKGQLGAALSALEKLELRGKITILGIAKRLEELYFPGDPYPLYLDKRSETLKIIQQARDEAHRFSLRHHRNRRSKSAISNELEGIKGIGPETVKELLRVFKSVKRVKEATPEQLVEIIGANKAKLLQKHFAED